MPRPLSTPTSKDALKSISRIILKYSGVSVSTCWLSRGLNVQSSRMFIVNAPAVFSVVWKMIKPWLDEKTQSKVTAILDVLIAY